MSTQLAAVAKLDRDIQAEQEHDRRVRERRTGQELTRLSAEDSRHEPRRHDDESERVMSSKITLYQGQRLGASGEFVYSPWRHGGWYVDNVRYPSGAVGCVSRNYADRKWRIVCDDRGYPGGPVDYTYANRDAAARAERELIAAGLLGKEDS